MLRFRGSNVRPLEFLASMLTIEPGISQGRLNPVDHDDVNVRHAPRGSQLL